MHEGGKERGQFSEADTDIRIILTVPERCAGIPY